MHAFYVAVFATVIALAGILIAVMVGYAQLVSNRFSPRLAQMAARDRLVTLLFVIMILLLVTTGFGAVVLSARTGGWSERFAQGLPMAVGVSVAAVLLLPLLWLVLRRLSGFADPSRLPELLLNEVDIASLAVAGIAESGLVDYIPSSISDSVGDAQEFDEGVTTDDAGVDFDTWRLAMDEAAAENERREDAIEEFLAKSPMTRDPLEPLAELLQRAITEGDRLLVQDILRSLCTILPTWVRDVSSVGPFQKNQLEAAIVSHTLRHHFKFLLEMLRVRQIYSLMSEITEGLIFLETHLKAKPELVYLLLSFHADSCEQLLEWQEESLAVRSLDGLFILGSGRLEAGRKELFEETCRRIGRVGELVPPNLIHRSTVRLMMPTDAPPPKTEILDTLVNGFHALRRVVDSKLPGHYPLIFADSVEVTLLAFIRRIKEEVRTDALNTAVMSLLDELGDLGIAAAQKLDGATSYLVLAKLSIVAEELAGDDSYLVAPREFAAQRIARVGVWAAANNVQSDGSVAAWAAKLLEEFAPEILGPIMKEIAIGSVGRGDVPHDVRWAFVCDVGRRVHSNFGLMFDSETGEVYPPEDSRRR